MKGTISLDGCWEFAEKDTQSWKCGQVPGCVQMDLIQLGELPDPFIGLNEVPFHALEEKDWVYRKEFIVSEKDIKHDQIELCFEGIDTFAEILLNGTWLGATDNMFVLHRFAIREKLLIGKNRLEVVFNSTIRRAKADMENSSVKLEYCCEPAAPYVRKAHYSFGWDWSPRILQTGIWRSVYMEWHDIAEITNLYCQTCSIDDGIAAIQVEAEVVLLQRIKPVASIAVELNGSIQIEKAVSICEEAGKHRIRTELKIHDAQLWFPNGMGNQPLYHIRLALFDDDALVSQRSCRFGIRMVRLIQNKDEQGESFIFEVNGQKVFAKGANWVPADNLIPRITRKEYYHYVKAARDANMNMLLCWGGGVYEDPAFYEACDEMGLMIFQTFMFHYAEYPAWDSGFISNITHEVETIVRQLRNHPSIVVWCGECENTWSFPSHDHTRGSLIYQEIIPRICAELDPSRPYRIGTPYGGEDPNSMNEGDRHSYEVYMGFRDYEAFTKDTTRFASEFGVQSMPSWKTVLSYTSPTELRLFSQTTLSHNKFPDAMSMLFKCIFDMAGLPADFRSFVYLSQYTQAEIIKLAVEHWRSRMYLTGGALFWQFNDCWPGTSFSCIDYYRRRKYLYYYAGRFFDLILPILRINENQIEVYTISDLNHEMKAMVTITGYRLNGSCLFERNFETSIPPSCASCVKNYSREELDIKYKTACIPVDHRFTKITEERDVSFSDMVIFVEINTVDGHSYSNYALSDRMKMLPIEQASISVQTVGNNIVLQADKPAFGVFIETQNDVILSDNGLTMEPGRQYTITCDADPGSIEIVDVQGMQARI